MFTSDYGLRLVMNPNTDTEQLIEMNYNEQAEKVMVNKIWKVMFDLRSAYEQRFERSIWETHTYLWKHVVTIIYI